MDLTAGLALLQGEASSRMRDTCRIDVQGVSSGVIDPVTGVESATDAVTVYAGPCRLRMGGTVAGSQTAVVAGGRVSTSTPTLSLPVGSVSVPVGAVVVITAVPAGDLAGSYRLGLRLRVTGVVLGTDMTAQRLTVETVTG